MSWSNFAVAAVAVACLNLLWWCLALGRRLRRMERTTRTDPLTGLGSGHWLETERWPAALRSGRPLGIAYLDLDHLKSRNDKYGHAVGDLYIQEAAKALRQASRRGVDEIFRMYLAGDEFLLLIHGPFDPHRLAQTLVERLRSYGVAASVGLAYSTETGYLPARIELRQAAEAACREAKAQGGDPAIVAPGADAATRSPPRREAAALGSQTSDCTPLPIDDEATAGLNPVQARQVQRLVAETARP
jgi:diguanylate cyclase (GGDEF)-like protein